MRHKSPKNSCKKILVVDDEPYVAEGVKKLLKKEGYKVATAHNADQCIKKIKEENYNLVITDVLMPGTSGIQLCEKIRKEKGFSAPKLILLTVVMLSENTRKKLTKMKVSDYIKKPFSNEDLLWRVNKAVSES